MDGEQHLFASENTKMISFVRKTDHKGLGYSGIAKLDSGVSSPAGARSQNGEDDDLFGTAKAVAKTKEKKVPMRGGIGIGVLNDTCSDDEDPYEIRPRISYNKTIGGDKKKSKIAANGALKPFFISKKAQVRQSPRLGLTTLSIAKLRIESQD